MANRDPFETLEPLPLSDPFAVLDDQPKAAAPLPIDPFEALTKVDPLLQLESIDDTADQSPDKGYASWIDLAMQQQDGSTLAQAAQGFGPQAPPTKLRQHAADVKDIVAQYGQASMQTMRENLPFGEQIAQTAEEVPFGIPASLFTQVGKVYSDLTGGNEEDNPLFYLGTAIRDATKLPDEQRQDETLFDEFYRAFNQAAGFAIGGKGISTLLDKGTKGATVAAAWLGSAFGGQAGREDAIRHGATDEQVDIAYYANSAFGLSEAAPLGWVFKRMDDVSGGLLSRKIKGKFAEMGYAGLVGGVTEATQEIFQTYGENITARDLAGYHPERSLTDSMMEAGGIGGTVGLTLGLLAGAVGAKNRANFEKDIKEKILDPLGITSLDELGDKMHELDTEYQNILKQIEQQDLIIEDMAEEDTQLEVNFETTRLQQQIETGGELSGIGVDNSEAVPSKDVQSGRTGEKIIKFAKMETNTELEGQAAPLTRIRSTPVVMAMTKYKTERADLLKKMRKEVSTLKAKAKTKEGLNKQEKSNLEKIEKNVNISDTLVKAEKQIAKELKSLTSSLMHLLPKGTKIIIDDYSIDTSNAGVYNRIDSQETGEVELITLRLDEYLRAIGDEMRHSTPLRVQHVKNRRARVLSTYLHEFGHALGYRNFQELYHKIQKNTATKEERTTWKAVANDYMRFIVDNITSPSGVAMANMMSLPRTQAMLKDYDNLFNKDYDAVIEYLESDEIDPRFQIPFAERVGRKKVDYLFSMVEYFAEEFSKIGLGLESNMVQNDFFKESVEDIKKALMTSGRKFKTSSPAMTAYFERHSLRQQLASVEKKLQKSTANETQANQFEALRKTGIIDRETAKKLTAEMDKWNRFMDIALNIIQIAKTNGHIVGLQNYVQHLDEWKNEVNGNLAVAEDRLTEWKNLGKKENEALSRLLTEETVGKLPDGGWLKTPRAFTKEEIATYKLSDEARELRTKIKADLRNSLNQMEQVLIAAKMEIFKDDLTTATQEVIAIKKEFKELRSRPYFPLMRFGEYVYQVFAKGDQIIDGQKFSDGVQVEFQAFDTQKERDQAIAKAKKDFRANKVIIGASKMVTPNFSLQGMPMTLLDHLETKLQSTDLSQEVKDAIHKVKNDALPFKSFRKQFQRRKRVRGYSMDAQRAYANYMTSFSNHIARVKFDSKFKDDFENVANSIKVITRKGGDSTDRVGILNHMNEHLQYVMNPVNEFVGLRSAAFFWFLGFNVKSAFVNLTQIPLVTYPYLAARFGDGKAVAALTRANKTAILALTNPKKVDAEEMKMISIGIQETWLDESLAQELALAASERNLDKTLPRHWRQQAWLKVSHYGSLPFHTAEKFNRHVTAIAAYRLSKADGKTNAEATAQAKDAVRTTQFEYARWARPKFMRGKVGGTAFVFQNYMQNALWFALGGDPGAFRMIIMLFALAGVMGLPFAENLADLYDAAMTALKKKTGVKDPHTAIRVDMRRMLKELDIDPDLVLHGMSSSSFGFANLGEFMGWPIPNVDLSGSLSMGRIIPGTELAAPGRENTSERVLAGGIERGGGAIASAGVGITRSIFDNHPDQWKRWEKAMPAFMRNISKAARYAVRGEEATRSGYPIAGFDMHDTKDQGEIIMQGLGFPAREVAKGWEGFIAQQQSVIYYETWKTGLLRQWNYAQEKRDTEAVKEIDIEIRAYNSQVPFGEMRIGMKTRKASWDSYMRTRQFNEAQIEQSKAFRRLSSSIEEVFEAGDNEDTP